MQFEDFNLKVTSDAVAAITRVQAVPALEEIIWNSLDGEAENVEVQLELNELQGLHRIVVRDDGHGMTSEVVRTVFEKWGDSRKKKIRHSPTKRRPYHGQNGQGRYKAFALGQEVTWITRAAVQGKGVEEVTIRATASQLHKGKRTPPVSCKKKRGTEVVIDDLKSKANSLLKEGTADKLRIRFAPYLVAHEDASITFDGESLLPSDVITQTKELPLSVEGDEDRPPLKGSLRIIEWNQSAEPILHLCTAGGMSLEEEPAKAGEKQLPFTAYLCSDRFKELADDGALSLREMDPQVSELIELARKSLKAYFRARLAEDSSHFVRQLKKDGVYPYKGQPADPVEAAERQVFDICASRVGEYLPSINKVQKATKKLTFSLLQSAVKTNPSNLHLILQEVLKLGDAEQEDLARLLKKTTLGAIISTASEIADRLTFINSLDLIAYDNLRPHVKERSQLHKILSKELWIFGEEFTMLSDDKSLRNVLHKHRELLGVQDIDNQIDPDSIQDLDDIPDLVLWSQYSRGREDEYENLVIELKRPGKNLNDEDLNQARRYARTIQADPRFDKERTRWIFYVVSGDVVDSIRPEINQKDSPPGRVVNGENHELWVKTWAELNHSARVRHQFLGRKLRYSVSSNAEGIAYLNSRHGELFPGGLPEPDGETVIPPKKKTRKRKAAAKKGKSNKTSAPKKSRKKER